MLTAIGGAWWEKISLANPSSLHQVPKARFRINYIRRWMSWLKVFPASRGWFESCISWRGPPPQFFTGQTTRCQSTSEWAGSLKKYCIIFKLIDQKILIVFSTCITGRNWIWTWSDENWYFNNKWNKSYRELRNLRTQAPLPLHKFAKSSDKCWANFLRQVLCATLDVSHDWRLKVAET